MKIPGSNDFGGFYKNTLPENRKERDITKSKGRGMEGNGGKKQKGLIKEHVWLTHGHGHGQQCGDWLWEPRGGLGRGGQRGENWYNSNRINKNKKRGQCHYDTRTSKKIYTKGKLQTSSPPGRVSKNSKQNVANQIHQYIERIPYHEKVDFILRLQRCSNIWKSIFIILTNLNMLNHMIILTDEEKSFD